MESDEKRRMLAGELYRADDATLVAERRRCDELLHAHNAELDEHARRALLGELLGRFGRGAVVEPPLYCDYGYNVALGAKAFVNFGAVMLDPAPIRVGDHAQLGPGVQLITATHPHEPGLRRSGAESAAPVTLEPNTWIGAGALVLPGVTVGADSVIGAGSVVVSSIPAGVVAAGNPCRVIRSL